MVISTIGLTIPLVYMMDHQLIRASLPTALNPQILLLRLLVLAESLGHLL